MQGTTRSVGALLALTLVACSGSAATGSSTSPRPVELHAIRNADAEVFMNVSATPLQTASVRRRLRHSPLVRQYAFVTRADAWQEFQKLFATSPDVIAGTRADQLPTSFSVRLAAGARPEALDHSFRDMPGVDEVKSTGLASTGDQEALADLKRACTWRSRDPEASDMEVFLQFDATPAQIAAVRSAIADSALVRSFAFVSHAEALRTFRQMFADHPKLLHSTTAVDLPESFRIGLKDEQTRRQLQDALEPLPGVDTFNAKTGFPVTAEGCRALARLEA